MISVSDTGANGDSVKSDFITVNVVIQQIDDPDPHLFQTPYRAVTGQKKFHGMMSLSIFTILEPLMQIGLFMEDRVCNSRLFYLLGLNISQKLMVQGS